MNKQLISKIEDLSINAWPSFKTELYDNWIIRFSHQYTFRTNCVEQIGVSTIAIPEKIKYCEQIYSDYKSPCIFKITPRIAADFDAKLDSLGYIKRNKTNVLTMPLEDFTADASLLSKVILNDEITDDWIFNVFNLNNITEPIHHKIVPNMFKAIPKKTIVAKVMADNIMVASGLGILDRDDLGLYAIYTHHDYRGRGYARAVCNTILNKAKEMGASYTYLQVVDGNTAAYNLYSSLGYKLEYSYWFRYKDVTGTAN